jgi:hypothetical protein
MEPRSIRRGAVHPVRYPAAEPGGGAGWRYERPLRSSAEEMSASLPSPPAVPSAP